MKRFGISSLLLLASLLRPAATDAQIYAKLNGLYALVGVVNPAVEFRLTDHSAFQTEFVYSPWKSINVDGQSKPMHFGIFLNEYRYYFRGYARGWYVGGNAGMMAFRMSKPYIENWGIHLENRYSKGYGFMFGACAGYERIFRERWVFDVFFGWSWMTSFYNGYDLDGRTQMEPHRPVQPLHPDPFNGSSEWYPNKIGISIGIRIYDPELHRQRSETRRLRKAARSAASYGKTPACRPRFPNVASRTGRVRKRVKMTAPTCQKGHRVCQNPFGISIVGIPHRKQKNGSVRPCGRTAAAPNRNRENFSTNVKLKIVEL